MFAELGRPFNMVSFGTPTWHWGVHTAAEELLLVHLRVLVSVMSTHGRRLAFGGNALLSLIMGRLRRQWRKGLLVRTASQYVPASVHRATEVS